MLSSNNGIFISIEGIEGAGKSSVIETVINWLKSQDITVITTREPGGTIIAEQIRNLILNDSIETMDSITELLLVFAARAQNIARCILPALKSGHTVVSDRFTDASFAYQYGGRGIDYDKIAMLEKIVHNQLQPDLTILLDLDANTGLSRMKKRSYETKQKPDRIEQEKESFFRKVRNCYLQRAAKFPERFVVIDASCDLQKVQNSVINVLATKIGKHEPRH